MPRVLTPLLTTSDLPLAELSAARLDGELYAVDECFAAVDEVDDATLRARALVAQLPARAIVEGESALWLFGVCAAPPGRHTLCVALAGRARLPFSPRWNTRERVLQPEDIVEIGGARVVSPLRSAVDILCGANEYGAEHRRRVHELMRIGGFDAAACLRRMDAHTSLAGSRMARRRLRGFAQPALLEDACGAALMVSAQPALLEDACGAALMVSAQPALLEDACGAALMVSAQPALTR